MERAHEDVIIPELEEWKLLDFTEDDMKIKLNFLYPTYVSTFEVKDSIRIQFILEEFIKA